MAKQIYKCRAELWIYPSEVAAWHFVTIPKKIGKELKTKYGAQKRGWGSLPVEVTIGKTTWKTSVFPDKRVESYIMPIKEVVRRTEGLVAGKMISFSFCIPGSILIS